MMKIVSAGVSSSPYFNLATQKVVINALLHIFKARITIYKKTNHLYRYALLESNTMKSLNVVKEIKKRIVAPLKNKTKPNIANGAFSHTDSDILLYLMRFWDACLDHNTREWNWI